MNNFLNIIDKRIATFIEKELTTLKEENHTFNLLLTHLYDTGDLFIIGGFLRDINHRASYRDIDFITSVSAKILSEIVYENCDNFKINHLGGFKIFIGGLTIDIWSVNRNWAFTKRISKFSESRQLDSLANGTFLNFDSIVYNCKTKEIHCNNYNACIRQNNIDIVRAGIRYLKYSNPKIAILLRCYYLRTKFQFEMSGRLSIFLYNIILYVQNKDKSWKSEVIKEVEDYPKYAQMFDWNSFAIFVLYVNFSRESEISRKNFNKINSKAEVKISKPLQLFLQETLS